MSRKKLQEVITESFKDDEEEILSNNTNTTNTHLERQQLLEQRRENEEDLAMLYKRLEEMENEAKDLMQEVKQKIENYGEEMKEGIQEQYGIQAPTVEEESNEITCDVIERYEIPQDIEENENEEELRNITQLEEMLSQHSSSIESNLNDSQTTPVVSDDEESLPETKQVYADNNETSIDFSNTAENDYNDNSSLSDSECSDENLVNELYEEFVETQSHEQEDIGSMQTAEDYYEELFNNLDVNQEERKKRLKPSKEKRRMTQQTLGFVDEFDANGKVTERNRINVDERFKQWQLDELPKKLEEDEMRICLNNVQSFGTDLVYPKVHQVSQAMKKYNINFLGGPESRVNPRCGETREIGTIFDQYHPGGMVFHTNTKVARKNNTSHQYGGVSSFLDAGLSRKYNGVECDQLGRWVTVKLLSQTDSFEIMTVYRCNAKPINGQKNCWYDQEEALLARRIKEKPEEQVIRDLEEELLKKIREKRLVIVMADANETLRDKIPIMNQMMKGLGMINVLQTRCGNFIPATNIRSKESINHIWVVPRIMPNILRVAIAPRNRIVNSDHLGIILDIKTTNIFIDPLVYVTPYEKRRLKSTIPKRAEEHRTYVNAQHKAQKISDRITTIEMYAEYGKKKEGKVLMESVDKQMLGIHLCGEDRQPAKHANKFSGTFQKKLKEKQKAKNKVNHLKKICKDNPTKVNKGLVKEAARIHKKKLEELRDMRINSATIRENNIKELAEAMHKSGKFKTKEIGVKCLIHIEKQREDARRQRIAHGCKYSMSLTHVMIPKACEYPEHLRPFYKKAIVIWDRIEIASGKDINKWEAITERSELEALLLDWQCLHFTQAIDTPLSSPSWEKILKEEKQFDTIEDKHRNEYNKLDPTTQAFLKELYRDQKSVMGRIQSMELEDFRQYIIDKDEKTSTSPSGHHLGHFKCLLDTDAFEDMFRHMKMAVVLEYWPERWLNTVTTIWGKDEDESPKIHRTRSIHVIETQPQFISHYYWSKQFLRYCELQPNHLTSDQYGGRRGRIAHTAVVQQQLLWDIGKHKNEPMITHLADARANFDRNICYIVFRALVARGFPEEIGRMYMNFLAAQIFYIRTAYGVSQGCYTREEDNRIFGDCQGFAWSAPNQNIISSVISNVKKALATKFEFSNHDGSKTSKKSEFYFIDDRSSNTMLKVGQKLADLLVNAQRDEDIQALLLNAAGGALAPTKCSVWILARNENSLSLKYKTEKAFPGTLHLRSTAAFPKKPLERVQPNKSKPYLGCRINPEMCPLDQKKALLKVTQKWVGEIKRNYMQPHQVVNSLNSRLYKKIEWPLVSSDMTFTQCDELMAKIRPILLGTQRLHTKTSKLITHGAQDLCGMGALHIYDLQGQVKLQLLKRHAADVKGDDFEDEFYELVQISLSLHMLWLGIFRNFLNEDFELWEEILAMPTWLGSVWKYLNFRKLKIDWISLPSYSFPRENDKFVMDFVHIFGYDGKDKQRINRVRVNLHILTLSDIVKENGITIHPDTLIGKPNKRKSTFHWQRAETIQTSWRKAFIMFMKDLQKYMNKTGNQLGKWIEKSHQSKVFYRLDDELISDGTYVYGVVRVGSHQRLREATEADQWNSNRKFVDVQTGGPSSYYPLDEVEAETLTIREATSFLGKVEPWKRKLWGMKPITKKVIQDIVKGCQKPFILSTDGGSPPSVPYGTFGYIFANREGKKFFENYGIVEMIHDQNCSERPEACGQLGPISLLNIVERIAMKHGVVFSSCREFSLDNEGISKHGKETVFLPKEAKNPNFDVKLQLVNELKANINNPDTLSWVPSHADKKKKAHEWTIQERLNIRADHLCHVAHRETLKRGNRPETIAPFFPAQRISVRNDTRRFVCEKYNTLHKDNARDELATYIKKKQGLSDEGFNQISWSGIRNIYRKAAAPVKIRLTKTMHHKRNTFRAQWIMGQHDTGLCALCGCEMETMHHLHECPAEVFKGHRDSALIKLKGEFMKMKIPDVLARFFITLIHSPNEAENNSNMLDELDKGLRYFVKKAANSQRIIGWHLFRQGMISRTWREVMDIVLRRERSKYTSEQWERRILQLIFRHNDYVWQCRCTALIPSEETYLQTLRRKANELLNFLKKHPHFVGYYKNLIRHKHGYFDQQTKYNILDWRASIKHAVGHTKTFNDHHQPRITKYFKYVRVTGTSKKAKSEYESGLRQIRDWLKEVSLYSDFDYDPSSDITLDVDPVPEPD